MSDMKIIPSNIQQKLRNLKIITETELLMKVADMLIAECQLTKSRRIVTIDNNTDLGMLLESGSNKRLLKD